MPLEKYQRGTTWWLRGRADGDGRYRRGSLGTSDPDIADAKIREIERKARQRALLGPDAPSDKEELTFSAAAKLYSTSSRDAKYIIKLIPHIGSQRIAALTGRQIKDLARNLYPNAAADTWHRQVIVPVRAVINHAAELELAHPIRIKGFSRNERIAQDRARGKLSRQEKTPADWQWIEAFRQEAFNPTAKPGQRRRRPNPYLAAIALFMFTTGARISQTVGIRRTRFSPVDVDMRNGKVFLPAAKGHDAQWVEITRQTMVDLANLPPRDGRAFGYKTRGAVYGPWRNICRAAGIDMIMPHAAGRHGFFTEVLVNQKEDITSAMEAGRAASSRLLFETYSHAQGAKKRIRDAMDQSAPGTNPVQSDSEDGAKSA